MLKPPGELNIEAKIPAHQLLTEIEFNELIENYRRGDRNAKEIIIQHNLRLVLSITQRFIGRAETDDLFQIGCLGLLKAVEKFDLNYGVKFSTYAVPLIIGEIKQYLRDEGPIKVSRSLKEIAVKVEQTQQRLIADFGREPTLSELTAASGLNREEIASALEATRPLNSFQEVVYADEGDEVSREDLVGESDREHHQWLEQYALQEIISQLPERLQRLVCLRFFEERTQSQVAEEFGVSQVQICRLEKEALYELRKLYNN